MIVEVVVALPSAQRVLRIELPEGSTVARALELCGLQTPAGATPLVGIFGRRVALNTVLATGDRVEVYRPLLLDPKEARRRRGSA